MPKDKPGAIEPGSVPSTRCKTRSQSHLVHTKHGTVKVVESVSVEDKP